MKKELTWRNRCQKCGEIDATTRERTFRAKNYIGPCADSFCYASCTMDTCREISAAVCDKCEKELKK